MADSHPETSRGNVCRADSDFEKALFHYRVAAAEDDADALNNLGEMYRQGLGVERNYRIAAACFLVSAEQGYIPAQRNLAAIFKYGRSVPVDIELAAQWKKLSEMKEAPIPLLLKAVNRSLPHIDPAAAKESYQSPPSTETPPELPTKTKLNLNIPESVLPEKLQKAGYAVGANGRSAKLRRRILSTLPYLDALHMLKEALAKQEADPAAYADIQSDIEYLNNLSQ